MKKLYAVMTLLLGIECFAAVTPNTNDFVDYCTGPNNSNCVFQVDAKGNVRANNIAFTAESFGALPSAPAATNTTAIQNALNAGQTVTLLSTGTFKINSTLVINSNTHLSLGPNTKIQMVTGGAELPIIVNSAYNTLASSTAVTVAWSNNNVSTVAWTNHGLSTGTWVWLSGMLPGLFDGIFPITNIVDANHFSVSMVRISTTSPSGQAYAKVADTNIIIDGGVWDANFPTNSIPTNVLNSFAVIMGVAEHVTLRDMKINNGEKYAVNAAAIRDFDVENLGADWTGSDFVHINGPAYNTRISHIFGHNGDDAVVLDCGASPTFAAYLWSKGGDIINADIHDIGIDNYSNVHTVALFPDTTYYMDNIAVSNVTGMNPIGGVLEIADTVYTSTINVNHVHFSNIGGEGTFIVSIGGTPAAPLFVNDIVMDNITMDPNPTQATLVNLGTNVNLKHVAINNLTFTPSTMPGGLPYSIFTSGTVGTLDINGAVVIFPGGSGRLLGVTGPITKVNLTNSYMTGGDDTIATGALSNVPLWNLSHNNLTNAAGLVLVSAGNVVGIDNSLTNMTNGLIDVSGTFAVNYAAFGNSLAGGSVIENTASGTPTLLSTVCDLTGHCTAGLPSITASQVAATVPQIVGQLYYCSNCTSLRTCISTGTVSGALSSPTSATTICN